MILRTINVVIFVVLLESGCTSYPVPHDNPFMTPDRGYEFGLKEEKIAELDELMKPCIDSAKESFPHVADRFSKNPPKGAQLYVVTRAIGYAGQFYVQVDAVKNDYIYGRLCSDIYAQDRYLAKGSKYTLPVSELYDWVISYPDRPEEGNLVGKYLLRRKDGLITGRCDPQDSELTAFRVYRNGYSFIPPTVKYWRVYGKEENLGSDFSMQKTDAKTGALDTIIAMRYRIPPSLDQKNLSSFIRTSEESNVGDANRFQLLSHEVSPVSHGENKCVLSHQLIKDNAALLKSGQRSPMFREIQSIVCVHPYKKEFAVVLTYAHRYPEGQQNSNVNQVSKKMFSSLSFY